jgi:predicted Zn-dependent peptidase
MQEYQQYTFPNGITIAYKEVTYTKIAHCGIMLDIGSRDEKTDQQGLAHFWEHMAFKGTEKRRSYHIINRLEAVGGELNAYTTKEKVCFHASVLNVHFERALELLCDITFNSIFPETQLERERGVILEEMSMYYDSLEDAIQDDFDEVVFPNHQLGANILGTQQSVKNFSRTDLQEFIKQNLDTERIVVSVVGNIPFKKVIQIAQKYLKHIPAKKSRIVRDAPLAYVPKQQVVERSGSQAHCAIGRPSYSIMDQKRVPFFMLTNLLGGAGMNSRLNMSIREKHGMVYSIDASYNTFIDTGFFGIYFATDPKQLKKAIGLIEKELNLLVDKPLTSSQLRAIKNQTLGQMAMSEESNLGFMLMMARSILDIGKVESFDEISKDIENISSVELQTIAQEMFTVDGLSRLIFMPS